MQIDQDRLKAENKNLVTAFREKSRKHQQTQELYDRLKRKEMTAATQSAAFESVDEVLGNVSGRQGFTSSHHNTGALRSRAQQDMNRDGVEQFHVRRKSGGNENQGSAAMMPPPLSRPGANGSNTFGLGMSDLWYPNPAAYCRLGNPMPTPSNHRTQLGRATQSASRPGAGVYRNPVNMTNGDLQHHTPVPRQALGGLSTNNVYKNGLSGYGMSAGMKVGRQQGTPE